MKIVITAFLALVLAIPGALGAEKVFRGASGAAWEEDGNWSDGTAYLIQRPIGFTVLIREVLQ